MAIPSETTAAVPRPRARIRRLTAAVVMTAAVLLAVAAFLRPGRDMVDFEVNYEAARRLRLGETLYRAEDGHYQFKYPPFSAMVYIPFSHLPEPAAKAAWFVLVLASSAAILGLAFALIPAARGRPGLAALVILVLGRFFLRELQLGQINAVITALLMLSALLLARGGTDGNARPAGDRRAGLLWGLTVGLKPYALIFGPYFILKRRRRPLLWGLAVLPILALAPAFFYGFRGNLVVHGEWIASLSRSTPTLLTTQDNVSLAAFFLKTTADGRLSGILYGTALTAIGLGLVVVIRRGRRLDRPLALEAALLLLLIPLISPLGWDYTFLSATAAVVLVIRFLPDLSIPWRVLLAAALAIIGLTLYDLLGRQLYADVMALSVLTPCFLAIAAGLARIRHRGLA